MTTRHEPLPPHALAAFLEGEVTPSGAAAIQAHLRDSGAARRHLEELEDIRRALSCLPEGSDEADRAAAAEIWRALEGAPAAAPPPARWMRPLRASAWLAACACVLIGVGWLVRGGHEPPGDAAATAAAEFRAKRDATVVPGDRWSRIEVLRIGADHAAHPLSGAEATLHAHEPLAFRYVNGGDDPFGFLMVFAVDAAGQIHWYYPAYETAGTDPESVPIRGGGDAIALPDAIDHDLGTGPLVLYAVFTRAPLHVLDVERRVTGQFARHGTSLELPARLPIPDSGQHVVRATVVP